MGSCPKPKLFDRVKHTKAAEARWLMRELHHHWILGETLIKAFDTRLGYAASQTPADVLAIRPLCSLAQMSARPEHAPEAAPEACGVKTSRAPVGEPLGMHGGRGQGPLNRRHSSHLPRYNTSTD